MTRLAKSAAVRAVIAADRIVHGRPDLHPDALKSVRNFLLLQSETALGTAILATPLVEALRHAIPGARIVIAAHGQPNILFRNNQFADALISVPDPNLHPQQCASAIRNARVFPAGERWCLLATVGNQRTGTALTAILTGASLRAGFSVQPTLMHLPLAFDPLLSQIANNLRLVKLFSDAAITPEPKVFFTRNDLNQADQLLSGAGIAGAAPIAIFITQTHPAQRKKWRTERFLAAAAHLARQHGARIVFIGAEKESVAIEAIRAQLSAVHAVDSISLAGKTTLPVLAALLAQSDIGLTLDTGNLHMGRCAGLPMCILAPAWSPPVEFMPLGDPRYRVLKNATIDSAPPDYFIDEVSVDEVCAALDDLLAAYPPSIESHRQRIQTLLAPDVQPTPAS